MDTEPTKRNTLPIKIAAFALLILIYIGITMYAKNTRESKPEDTATNGNSANEQAIGNDSEQTSYKDGTYTAVGKYSTPGGPEEVNITVTLVDGVIVSSSASAVAKAPISEQFQNEFINNYKAVVVGKDIGAVKLDKVAGSSLTPKGFNEALNQIKTQAQQQS